MVGSVRGNVRFDSDVRVEHASRSGGSSAWSFGGQTRLAPAWTESVLWPQVPQKVLRKFQSR